MLTYELMPLDENEIEQQTSCFEPISSTRHHLKELIKQLVQHNMRVIERYYSRIRLERLAELVGVS